MIDIIEESLGYVCYTILHYVQYLCGRVIMERNGCRSPVMYTTRMFKTCVCVESVLEKEWLAAIGSAPKKGLIVFAFALTVRVRGIVHVH
jgi:hypothetical protein